MHGIRRSVLRATNSRLFITIYYGSLFPLGNLLAALWSMPLSDSVAHKRASCWASSVRERMCSYLALLILTLISLT